MDYIKRAEKAVEEEEKVRENRETMTDAKKERLEEEIICNIQKDQPMQDDFAFLISEQERMIKEDKLRSQLEYGRHQGLTDVELISIAVETGVPHDYAEHLVENTLQDDVDRQFYRDEKNSQEEYLEENEEFIH